MEKIKIINPATEKICAQYQEFTLKQVQSSIENAHLAFEKWSNSHFDIRSRILNNLANLLRNNQADCAIQITHEMGKPISESNAEVEKCAKLCEYYANNGKKFLRAESIQTEFYKSYRSYQPMGLIFGVMPWNFPFWQVMRFAIPNLAAGNGIILKHASQTTGCALLIEKLMQEAGFPEFLFKTLVISSTVAHAVIEHPLIRGVTLTGSESTGRKIAEQAGANLKKVVMELGGSDPYIILPDANLKHAAAICVKSRLLNAGQVCIAAKRLIVVDSVKEEFTDLVLKQVKKYTCGDPTHKNTTIGPMVSKKARADLHEQVTKAIESGATCLLGGQILNQKGYFYPATILDNVSEHSRSFHEEMFGPVICLTNALNEAHAISLANSVNYGLGAAIFTKNIKKGEIIAREKLEAGFCAVNNLVASDPRLPFGGIKNSGFGRELSREGMHEFMNIKTITVSK